jgi:ParB family chromosome partitioning protein
VICFVTFNKESEVMAESNNNLKNIVLGRIFEPEGGLRKVDRTLEKYQGLVESIRLKGVMNPISVRELRDPDTGDLIYGLIDGLQRLNASKDAGLEEIPCHIMSLEEGELLEAQIMANVHKIETRPVEYSRALLRMLSENPTLTRTELADKLAKTTAWISERLGLLKLTEEIGNLVDEDKIGLSNAYALAKLPQEEQSDFVDRAMTMTPQQFTPTVNARVKEIRDAKRKGKDAAPEEFQPVPLMRGKAELVSEMQKAEMGPVLVSETKASSPEEGFALGVLWALQLDPRSCEVQKAQDRERKEVKARAREKAKVEQKKKRAKEAADKAESLKREAEEAIEEEKTAAAT